MSGPIDTGGARKRGVPREFDRVASRYDLLQRLNPGYVPQIVLSARRLGLPPHARLLDLCCGTGLSTLALRRVHPHAAIDALDASSGMLAVARARGLPGEVRFVQGDATDPRAAGLEGPYDGILMSYGARNLPDLDRGLAAVLDLLRPAGIACFHEYALDGPLPRLLWRAVSGAVIVPLGELASPGTGIYRYLRESVLRFDSATEFRHRLRRSGYIDVRSEPMGGWTRGILHSFLGRRPGPGAAGRSNR